MVRIRPRPSFRVVPDIEMKPVTSIMERLPARRSPERRSELAELYADPR